MYLISPCSVIEQQREAISLRQIFKLGRQNMKRARVPKRTETHEITCEKVDTQVRVYIILVSAPPIQYLAHLGCSFVTNDVFHRMPPSGFVSFIIRPGPPPKKKRPDSHSNCRTVIFTVAFILTTWGLDGHLRRANHTIIRNGKSRLTKISFHRGMQWTAKLINFYFELMKRGGGTRTALRHRNDIVCVH